MFVGVCVDTSEQHLLKCTDGSNGPSRKTLLPSIRTLIPVIKKYTNV